MAGKTIPNCAHCGRFINPKKGVEIEPGKFIHKRCVGKPPKGRHVPGSRYGIAKVTIHAMREKGWTSSAIARETGYSKSTVSYHLSPGQKEKTRKRDAVRKVYKYLGDRMTAKRFKGKLCKAVLREDGKCIRGRNGSMLVEFLQPPRRAIVVGRLLRIIKTA